MPRISATLGFATYTENEPGIVIPSFTEQRHKGLLINNRVDHTQGGQINPTVTVSHKFSTIVDETALSAISSVKYVILYNTKWRVTSFTIQSPRVIFTLGGTYND